MQKQADTYFNPTASHPQTTTLSLSWEFVAYTILISIVTLFFLADVDIVPMSDAESTRAITSWHALRDIPGEAPTPASPMLFTAHMFSYAFLSINEFSARLPGLIAGITLIILTPILMRPIIGRRRAFAMTLVIALSPFLILTSRSADPAVFTITATLIWIWALWQHWQTRTPHYLGFASVAFAFSFFLSAPHAPLLFVVIVVAFALALYWTLSASADTAPDATPDQRLSDIRTWLASWNISKLAFLTFGTIFIFATIFMFYPLGLAHVAQLLEQTFTPNSAPIPTLVSLITYDPLLIILAFIGTFIAITRAEFGLMERFAFLWLLLATLTLWLFNPPVSTLLWLLPPASFLIAYLLDICLQPMADDTYSFVGTLDEDAFIARYGWVKWLVAIAVTALLLLLSFHWQVMARNLLSLPMDTDFVGAIPILFESLFIQFRYSAIWLMIASLFLFVGFFLCASLWGTRNTWQGYGLGLIAFALLSGFGGGYNASAVPHRLPEAWHAPFTEANYATLRQTLIEVAQRDNSGFLNLPVSVIVDDPKAVDPLILWTLRDFTQVNYTAHLSDVARQQIILMNDADPNPELGGSYVGQSFALRTYWTPANLQSLDAWSWLANRSIRRLEYNQDRVILWLRQDVFEGVPPSIRP